MPAAFRKYLILFSLIIVSLPTKVFGCSWYVEGETLRFLLFNPDFFENKAWWTYYYTTQLHYMDGSVKSNEDERIIAEQWKSQLKLKSTVAEIQSFLFDGLNSSELLRHPFTSELQHQPKLGRYLHYAKLCEFSVSYNDPWQSNYTDSLVAVRAERIVEGLKAIQVEQSLFWKKKYAFQVLRLAYYFDDPVLFDKIFAIYFGLGNEQSPVDWWATHYKSMMLERQLELDSANYLHALVFCNSTNKMFASRLNFSSGNFTEVFKLARTDIERSHLLVMKEIVNPGPSMPGINAIYLLNSDHKMLPLLLIRELNKIEDWSGTYKYTSVSGTSKDDKHYVARYAGRWKKGIFYLRDFANQVRRMNKLAVSQPDFYHLFVAQLSIMNRQVKSAELALKNVKGTDSNVLFQKTIIELLIRVFKMNLSSEDAQDLIGADVKFLLSHRNGQFESDKVLFSLFKFLAASFRTHGSNHIAGLFDYFSDNKFCGFCSFYSFEYNIIQYFDRYGTISDVEKVISLFSKTTHNKLEELLLQPYTHPYYFYELLGTMYLREGKSEQALATYSKIPDSFWIIFSNMITNLDTDPFDMSKHLRKFDAYPFYNKYEIVNEIVRLESGAKLGKVRDLIKLGNAWFNFSKYGTSWFMLNYGWTSAEGNQISVDDQSTKEYIFRAIGYYTKALELATNEEERAEIAFYLATAKFRISKSSYRSAAAFYETFRETWFYRLNNCEYTVRSGNERYLDKLFSD